MKNKEARTLRLEKVRQSMEQEALDIVLVCSPDNIFYLSGFVGTEGVVVVTQEEACLLVDFRYMEQAQLQAPGWERVQLKHFRGECVVDCLREKGWLHQGKGMFPPGRNRQGNGRVRVGLEEDFLSWSSYTHYKGLLKECDMVGFSQALARQRQIKDAAESALIQQAAELTDRGFTHILREIQPGRTEREIALALEFALRDWGADGCSFSFIVASGPRASMPHAATSSRVLARGDLVLLDFGICYAGYCSDITRTVCLGEPTARQQEVYDVVREAQETGLRALRAGKTGREVDACARTVIEEAGYGSCFGHGLGHGVGISVHEGPCLNMRDETCLAPGMILTVEPGIYIPDWGGVRIEDMALVTENEARVLTQSPKQFIIIE
ncbi:MAG: aminopeptidase P family protein [Peptococcaceae bacterium]|nr:aminopeptidase P family protein [Peptococcaceae bacterium]